MNVPILASSKPSNSSRNISWPKASSVKQQFSFSDTIIYYIAKNPSTPKCYLKLVKSCKYFFEKQPLLVVARIHSNGKFCSIYERGCIDMKSQCCVEIHDLKKLSSKIWLTIQLEFSHNEIPNFASLLVPKLYRCEEANLRCAYKNISLKDFQLFASAFQKFFLVPAKIISNDGSEVMLEKILEIIPAVKNFYYFSEFNFFNEVYAVTATTMKNILALQNLGNIQFLALSYAPEIINIEDLGKFIKIHKDTKFWITFSSNISKEYENQIDNLIDAVIASGVPNRIIRHNRQDLKKLGIMYDFYTP